MREYWFNSNCYKQNGNRVAVFGRPLGENIIGIFALECSKKDQFSKKVATEVYKIFIKDGVKAVEALGYSPKTALVARFSKNEDEEDSLEYTFFKYCNDSYYKKRLKISRHFVYKHEFVKTSNYGNAVK